MIVPPGVAGVAFTEAADGDMRSDRDSRSAVAARLGISPDWATISQVHESHTVRVGSPGPHGEADAVWTDRRRLPVSVFTADCFGVVVHADAAVGVAHAGWRGAHLGVVGELLRRMRESGHEPRSAHIGPGIGPCCFEVGDDVSERFPSRQATTTVGTAAVDLPGVLIDQLDGLDPVVVGGCTHHDDSYFSHRRDGSPLRMAALGWLP